MSDGTGDEERKPCPLGRECDLVDEDRNVLGDSLIRGFQVVGVNARDVARIGGFSFNIQN